MTGSKKNVSKSTPSQSLCRLPLEPRLNAQETMADGGGSKTKEINASLKAAKEAIKRKEYKEAAKYCRVTWYFHYHCKIKHFELRVLGL